jgi:hypothetical protein
MYGKRYRRWTTRLMGQSPILGPSVVLDCDSCSRPKHMSRLSIYRSLSGIDTREVMARMMDGDGSADGKGWPPLDT